MSYGLTGDRSSCSGLARSLLTICKYLTTYHKAKPVFTVGFFGTLMPAKGQTNNPQGINQYDNNRSKSNISIRFRQDIEQKLRQTAKQEGKTLTAIIEEALLRSWENQEAESI